MKAFLLYRDSDPAQADLPLPPNAPELINDLALNPVIEAMADGDEFLRDVALRTVMASMSAPDDIIYRQQILVDCLEHPGTVRKLYGLAVEAVEAEKKIYRSIFNNYPEAVLGRSIESLNALMAVLRHLRRLAADALQDFTSPGMRRFFTMITDELSDEYFDAVDIHLRRLKFRGGVEISAGLGTANEGAGYRLRRSAAIPWPARTAPAPVVRPGPVSPVLPDPRPRRGRLPRPVNAAGPRPKPCRERPGPGR